MSERKVTIDKALDASQLAALKAEHNALVSASVLAKYYHKKYMQDLSNRIGKIEVMIKYWNESNPTGEEV